MAYKLFGLIKRREKLYNEPHSVQAKDYGLVNGRIIGVQEMITFGPKLPAKIILHALILLGSGGDW